MCCQWKSCVRRKTIVSESSFQQCLTQDGQTVKQFNCYLYPFTCNRINKMKSRIKMVGHMTIVEVLDAMVLATTKLLTPG